MSRPQEFKSALTDIDAALAQASAYIFDGWTLTDCNPLVLIDWNAPAIRELGFNDTYTAFEANGQFQVPGARFQLISDALDNNTFVVSPSFGGQTDIVAAAAWTGQMIDDHLPPFCLLDWQEKQLHHLIRDEDGVATIIQNYPEEPLGVLTTYENMEL